MMVIQQAEGTKSRIENCSSVSRLAQSLCSLLALNGLYFTGDKKEIFWRDLKKKKKRNLPFLSPSPTLLNEEKSNHSLKSFSKSLDFKGWARMMCKINAKPI